MFHNFVFRCKITAFVAHKCSVFLHICTSVWWISPHEASLSYLCLLFRMLFGVSCVPASILFCQWFGNILPLSFRYRWLSCSAGSPIMLVAFLGALCASARENSPPSTKKVAPKAIFICSGQKKVVSLSSNPMLEGNMFCKKRFANALWGRFLTY